MARRPDQSDASRPPRGTEAARAGHGDQVDELDLLGWVEGDLPRARQAPVEALLAREPRLRELLDAMAADRAAFRSIPAESAPPDLLSRVEQQLERDLLVGLTGAAGEVHDIPVSRVSPPRRSVVGRIVRSPWLSMSAAAAMLLVAGAVGFAVYQTHFRSPLVGPELATGPSTLVGPTEMEATLALATPDDGVAEGDIPAELLPREEPAPLLSALVAARASVPEPTLPTPDESITTERAVELLREGRLAIRVRTLDRDRTLGRLASIHLEPRTTWSLLDRADEAVVMALSPPAPPPGLDQTLMASSREAAAARIPPLIRAPERRPAAPAVYLAEVDATPRAIGAIRGVLGNGLDQSAEFVALDEPLPLPPAMSIDAVLWWKRPPSGWVTRYTAPVIVETVKKD